MGSVRRNLLTPKLKALRLTSSLTSRHLLVLWKGRFYEMIGSFLTRGLLLAFGYAYPAYECYKTVEKNRPEIEQLRFWCQYWILVAVLTVFERFGDAFISWVPMYSEAKLAFFIYLWYPKTRGTTYVYDSFFRPYLSKHETDIDRNLLELRTWVGDFAILYWQRAASYGQTRVFDVLQYIAAQSAPRPAQPQQPGTQAPTRQSSTPRVSVEPAEPPSPASSNSSSQEQVKVVEPTAPKTDSSTSLPSALKVTPSPAATIQSVPGERGVNRMETEEATVRDEMANPPTADLPPPKETLMEEMVHLTRARLRRA
ncbi:hypothetical protein MLD38_024812 [Melastoma candidum]|uniref:Uncharacterized protein n=1 Tax=Melastoma candidum TaxID=119954 RepID=A0ACB9NTI9_9MYRT|nr:hypothetical protein MLD38_024812 [Melastoma candidum]